MEKVAIICVKDTLESQLMDLVQTALYLDAEGKDPNNAVRLFMQEIDRNIVYLDREKQKEKVIQRLKDIFPKGLYTKAGPNDTFVGANIIVHKIITDLSIAKQLTDEHKSNLY